MRSGGNINFNYFSENQLTIISSAPEPYTPFPLEISSDMRDYISGPMHSGGSNYSICSTLATPLNNIAIDNSTWFCTRRSKQKWSLAIGTDT